MSFLWEDIGRIALAALLGAVIGVEREWRGKSAGFRTMMLVSIGSALFTIVSLKMALLDPNGNSDVTRIASSIITGIGFLGAGLIFKGEPEGVQGLTTAATVWATAAVGMAIGMGSIWLGLIITALIWTILYVFHDLEDWVLSRFETRKYRISWPLHHQEAIHYEDYFDQKLFKLREEKLWKYEDRITAIWTVKASKKEHDQMVWKLMTDKRIIALEY